MPHGLTKAVMRGLSALVLALVLAAGLGGCAHGQADFEGEAVYQISTIDLLMAGGYEGQLSLGELATHGDHGLGTFNALDGEMIMVDGAIYQIKSDGRVYRPGPEATTPFAAVFRFKPASGPWQETTLDQPLDLDGLQAWLDKRLSDPNLFYAVRLDGTFTRVKTRSVPVQDKPYPPLTEVVKNGQKVFELDEVKGTLVGLRSPGLVKGVNVPGYHFHFIDDKRLRGGHVLDLRLGRAQVQTQAFTRLELDLPRQPISAMAGQAEEASPELRAVERGR